MPIYEYRCAACGHELEALQKLSDAPLTECPSCHKPELKKLLSAAGFQLKGSGWYATDFRNSGAKPAAKDKSATKSPDSSGATSRHQRRGQHRGGCEGRRKACFSQRHHGIEACSTRDDAEERVLASVRLPTRR